METQAQLEPMQWQSQLPTSYDYTDMQMLDVNNIVAVGLTGSFIHSDDAGLSWKFVWTKTLLNLTSVDFPQIMTGYACGNGNEYYFEPGILVKTIDGGNSWDSLSLPFDANLSSLDFISIDTGWVAGDSGNVFRTYNGGISWDDVSFPETKMIRDIVMLNADTGFVAGDGGITYRTFDGGNNWTTCPPSTIDKINSLFFLNGRTGWCTTDFEKIYRTDNSGDTWVRQLNGGGTSPVNSICFIDSLRGHALSTAFRYRTTNGGQTWQTQNQTYHYNFNIAFYDSLNGFISGSHGNIQKTIDGGISWFDVAAENNFYHYKNIQFTSAITGYCVGEYGKIRKTVNGGQTWNYLNSSTLFDLNDLFFFNSNIGYVVGEAGSVLKTTNGGISFTTINTSSNEDLYGVYFMSEDTGWVCGANGAVYKTIDGGINWAQKTLPSFTYGAYDIVFTNALTGYIGSWANRIYKTLDGGDTWTEIAGLPSVNSVRKIQFINPDTGWATSEYGNIIKTTDAGQTWTIQNNFCFSPAYAFHFFDSMNGFAAGGISNYNCRLYRTRDGGDTWENTDLPFGYNIHGLWMTDTNRVYIAADYGSIILYGDTADVITTIDKKLSIDNKIVCYPNPASEFVEIIIPGQYRNEELIIYNSKGQLVNRISGSEKHIVISGLENGIYFFRMKEKIGKFVVQ